MDRFEEYLKQYEYGTVVRTSDRPLKINQYMPEAKSLGEKQIRKILEDLGYRYGHEYFIETKFQELGNLRFDFLISPLKFLIEFDGQQHYEGGKYSSSRDEWLNGIMRDEKKNEFCKNNSYSLLRIPYVYSRNYRKMKKLIEDTIAKIRGGETIHDLDLYFKWKSGIISI